MSDTRPEEPGRGAGHASDGRGNRGRGRGRFRGRAGNRMHHERRFEGMEPTLKGKVFDFSEEPKARQYSDNVEAVMRYVGTNYKQYTADLVRSIEMLQLDMPAPVADPAEGATAAEVERWKMAYKKNIEQVEVYQNFLAGLFNLLLGQCTEIMKDKLRARLEYEEINQTQNGIRLLALIKQLTFTYDDNRRYEVEARDEFKANYYGLKKDRHQTVADFYQVFKAHVKACTEVGVTLYDESTLLEITMANGREEPNDQDKDAAQDRVAAMRFIRACGNTDYEAHLKNKFLDGENAFPITLADARAIMEQRVERNARAMPNDSGTGIAFMTEGRDASGKRLCFRCGSPDHMVAECPQPRESNGETVMPRKTDGVEAHEISHVLSITQTKDRNRIPRNWILLDNQATIDIFCNENLVEDIREVNEGMTVIGSTGTRTTMWKATLPGYGEVWFDRNNAANILCMRNMKARFRVSHDTDNGDTFRVRHRSTGDLVMEFVPSEDGLYYYEASSECGNVLVTTVAMNKSRYTKQDVMRATEARKLQRVMGRPSTRDFIEMIEANGIPNCPFNRADVMAAEDIFGPDVGSIKGKTTRRRPGRVWTETVYTGMTSKIPERYRKLILCADVMHVNGVPMLVTKTRNLHFGTIDTLLDTTTKSVRRSIQKTLNIYNGAGFRVVAALMDGAFEPLRPFLTSEGVTLNTTSRDEHVGDIERYIRTIKERMRSTYNMLPFNKLPRVMVMELAKQSVFWLNSFPVRNGISESLSPRTIMTGEHIDYKRHCKYEFGEYVQTHEPHDNTMVSRTVGAIALRPTGNRQGGFYFMSLVTGRVINRANATPLPMPGEVVTAVERLAIAQEAEPGLAFGNRDNRILFYEYEDDDNDEYSHHESVDEDLVYHDDIDQDEIDGLMDNDDALTNEIEEAAEVNIAHDGTAMEEQDDAEGSLEQNAPDGHEDGVSNHEDSSREEDSVAETENDVTTRGENHRSEADGNMIEHEERDDGSPNEDNECSTRSGRYNLRERRRPNYSYRYGHEHEGGMAMVTVTHPGCMSTPQMNLKHGLQAFGESGEEAVKKELRQLHERGVISPRRKDDLSNQQIKEALSYLMFLKRKRCGQIKARGCADGRKQRAYIDKIAASSPTVATESVFITGIMDAAEHRCVGVVDVPGAFMQAIDTDGTMMRIDGRMAELLVEIDGDTYGPCVTHERGKSVIYVRLERALYGTLKAARLFWEKLTSKLQEWGFETNPYDSCVANKTFDGKQCTVVWHVDDIKISHADPKIVDQVIELLESEFGKEEELSKSFGLMHDYLGMDLDFSEPGVLTVRMENYIRVILKDVPPDMMGRARTPAAKHLFRVNTNDAVSLNSQRADTFHRITMQLMYLSLRGRPDIRLAVSFLSSRVACPDEDDYKKLCRVVKYLQSTIDLPLRLACDGSRIVRWWVDAAYTVHADMKGHTGATMSLGRGCPYSSSTKQKLVTRSSTECELVGVHDTLPQILWTKNFIAAQGYDVKHTVLYQDNKSAILLENNGRMSSTKRTKHIELRYFYIKDKVSKKEINIEYCPTEDMVSDFFTKPTQGSLFLKQRDIIMNIDPSSDYHSNHRSVLGNDANELRFSPESIYYHDTQTNMTVDHVGIDQTKLYDEHEELQEETITKDVSTIS